MKTCSDSLKALLHQYRTGEKRTWYIADLYTMWLNSSERTDKLLGWNPYSSGNIVYASGRFGLGLYDPARSEADIGKPLIKASNPSEEVFDWNENDWTIEYFTRWTSFPFGYLSAGGTYFSVTDYNFMNQSGFRMESSTMAVIQNFWFWTYLNGERTEKVVAISLGTEGTSQYANVHYAVCKKGRDIYTFFNGTKTAEYHLADNEIIDIPSNAYMYIDASAGDCIMDEFRISSCARYTQPFDVPTQEFTPDVNTLSLLHFNGNLNDEGFMADPPTGMKDFRSGEMYLYTGHDTDLTCGGNKYRHIAIEHGDIEESRGTETATMDLTINYNPSDTITPNDERTWFKALKDGIFDKAYVSLDRLYSPIPWQYNMPNIPIDYVLKSRFFGRMEVQEVKLDHASIQIKSPTDMLSKELPRNLIKPSCLNHFGDFMCQINPEKYKVHTTAQEGSSKGIIVVDSNYLDGYFNNGMIYSTSGKNKGQYSSIKSFSNHRVVLFKPFTEEVNAGDTFDLLCGCDKTMNTCKNVYSNLIHFRGCPFLPCKNVLM